MYTSTGTAVQVLQPYRSTSYNAGELDENDDAKVYAAPPPCQAPVVCRRAQRAQQGLAAAISSRPRVRVRRQTPRDSYPFSDAQCQSLTPAARFSLRQNPMGILLGQNFRCCKRNVLVIALFGLSLLYSYSYCTLDIADTMLMKRLMMMMLVLWMVMLPMILTLTRSLAPPLITLSLPSRASRVYVYSIQLQCRTRSSTVDAYSTVLGCIPVPVRTVQMVVLGLQKLVANTVHV
jgi:hypothetical protein